MFLSYQVLSDRDMSDANDYGAENGADSEAPNRTETGAATETQTKPKSGTPSGTPKRTKSGAPKNPDSQPQEVDSLRKEVDSMHVSGSAEESDAHAQTFHPIDADVRIANEPKVDATQARLLLEKAESMRSSDSDSDAGDAAQVCVCVCVCVYPCVRVCAIWTRPSECTLDVQKCARKSGTDCCTVVRTGCVCCPVEQTGPGFDYRLFVCVCVYVCVCVCNCVCMCVVCVFVSHLPAPVRTLCVCVCDCVCV